VKELAFPELKQDVIAAAPIEKPLQKVDSLLTGKVLRRLCENIPEDVNEKELEVVLRFCKCPIHLHSHLQLRNLLFYDEFDCRFDPHRQHHA
jgi:hypothetical protein